MFQRKHEIDRPGLHAVVARDRDMSRIFGAPLPDSCLIDWC